MPVKKVPYGVWISNNKRGIKTSLTKYWSNFPDGLGSAPYACLTNWPNVYNEERPIYSLHPAHKSFERLVEEVNDSFDSVIIKWKLRIPFFEVTSTEGLASQYGEKIAMFYSEEQTGEEVRECVPYGVYQIKIEPVAPYHPIARENVLFALVVFFRMWSYSEESWKEPNKNNRINFDNPSLIKETLTTLQSTKERGIHILHEDKISIPTEAFLKLDDVEWCNEALGIALENKYYSSRPSQTKIMNTCINAI